MGYPATIYSVCDLKLPDFNWRVSVSVDVFNFADTTPYKVFWQMEPPEINDTEAKLIKNAKFYDLILTWNSEVLSQCSNAKLFPPGGIWFESADISQKQFAVSYLTSSKRDCWGHRYRQEIYDMLPSVIHPYDFKGSEDDIVSLVSNVPLPITKHRSPPYLKEKRSLLEPFQFQIVMENCQRSNFFTEKINDCFASKTIPIYWGAPNIREFFNNEGLLSFSNTEELLGILKWITPKTYQDRFYAVEENYKTVMKYKTRTTDLVKAIEDSWTPHIEKHHSGEPNVG